MCLVYQAVERTSVDQVSGGKLLDVATKLFGERTRRVETFALGLHHLSSKGHVYVQIFPQRLLRYRPNGHFTRNRLILLIHPQELTRAHGLAVRKA